MSIMSCPGILITGGKGQASTTTELYVPADLGPVPAEMLHCSMPDLPKGTFGHSQDGFTVCGGYGMGERCYTLTEGVWERTYSWTGPPRSYHVSWSSAQGIYLMGGSGSYASTGTTSTLLRAGGAEVGFKLVNPTVNSCSIQLADSVIVTGGHIHLPYADGRQVVRYFSNGTHQVLPSLLSARQDHSCGSYEHKGNQVWDEENAGR